MRIGIVKGGLEGIRRRWQECQFRHSGAVDLLDARVVVVHVRQHRVGHRPVDQCTLSAAADLLFQAPFAGHPGLSVDLRAVAEVCPAAGGIVLVVTAVSQRDHLLRGVGEVARCGGELAFVLEVDRHRHAQHRHGFCPWRPSEVLVPQQTVITRQRGQIVAVSVAVALRVHPLGIRLIDHAVSGAAADLFLDIVIGRVDRLAAVDAVSVVPN